MTCPPRPQFRVAQRKAGSVDRFETCCPSSWVFVYADGRVISWVNRAGGISEQVIERRLTPEGVELVRSGILQARDLLGPTNEVPTDAWEDPKARAFVPSRYSVCAWTDDYTQAAYCASSQRRPAAFSAVGPRSSGRARSAPK